MYSADYGSFEKSVTTYWALDGLMPFFVARLTDHFPAFLQVEEFCEAILESISELISHMVLCCFT